MDKIGPEIVAVLAGIVTLATIAVIFGSKQSASVLQAGGSAFSSIIGAAVAPATGGSNSFGAVGAGTSYLGGAS